MFVNGFVEEVGEDRCEERCYLPEDGWFDFINITGFVGVDFVHCFGDLRKGDALEFERRGFAISFRHDVFFLVLWDGLTGFVADGNVAVVEGIGDVSGVCVCFPFVDDEGWGGSTLCSRWDH